MTIQFEAGKTYTTRSICDHNCIVEIEVLKRTAATITAKTMKGVKILRVAVYEGAEQVSPWGRYSMAPVVSADDEPGEVDRGALFRAVARALEVA